MVTPVTRPELQRLKDEEDLLLFKNAYSVHTHTMPVLSHVLTQANQLNGKTYFEAVSILEVLRASNVIVWWITNQVLYGVFDNMVTVLAKGADTLIALNKNVGEYTEAQLYDEAIIPQFEKFLNTENANHNRVLFIHLIGNHWPYCERYPSDFERFTGDLPVETFGILSGEEVRSEMINCYDNSVLYNDHVVASLLKILKSSKKVAGLLYFSDHGEDLFEMKGHHSDQFTYAMTQIPMVAWFSNEYQKKYPRKYLSMVFRRNQLFSNDFVYDTLIGLFGIETGNYEAKHDLSSDTYSFDIIDAKTLLGKMGYATSGNTYFQEIHNLEGLRKSGLFSKYGVANVHTLGKLANLLHNVILNIRVEPWISHAGVFSLGSRDAAMIQIKELMGTVPNIFRSPDDVAPGLLLMMVMMMMMTNSIGCLDPPAAAAAAAPAERSWA